MKLELADNGPIHKMSHIADIGNLLEIDNLNKYVNKSFFNVFSISNTFLVNVDSIVAAIVF